MKKQDLIKGLVIILDLPNTDTKELTKLAPETLERIYEGQKKNAIAYQDLVRNK